ncbi:hypothetical protein, partial [Pauljensenia sp. UMB3104]|uniref:hypothetical protein n=1 Tax=Pauljensenia sp. UMB3104 TaxID=3046331 RepID=UPI0027BAB930
MAGVIEGSRDFTDALGALGQQGWRVHVQARANGHNIKENASIGHHSNLNLVNFHARIRQNVQSGANLRINFAGNNDQARART